MLLDETVWAVVGPNPETSRFDLIFAMGDSAWSAWENALLVLHPDRSYDITFSRNERLAGGKTTQDYQTLKKIWFDRGFRARKVNISGLKP